MLQLIPYGVAALLGGMLGKKLGPAILSEQMGDRPKDALVERTPTSLIEIVGERLIQEESIILATEDVPLDNRHGNKALTSEHEFVRTAEISFAVERSLERGNQVRSSVLRLVDGLVEKELKKALHIEFGTQVTRRVKIHFSTEPGQMVRYRLVWKQTSRRGIYYVNVGTDRHVIPYVVTFGLFHSVESLGEGDHAPA
ncbi:hypothetical protein SIID45300_02216 [Candidatus Magnetaquicoccaceae bacterium FCR-1]|uniref:Uncharacterized protein n=1 Tax=Candidatus Magnetaquiglobus chichijimensis TaxID=3141448 RepID=A0ABQ0CAH0_9PROT